MAKLTIALLSAVALAAMVFTTGILSYETSPLSAAQISNLTRYDQQNCDIAECFDSAWQCQQDQDCVAQAQVMSQQYLANPENFEQIIAAATNANLIKANSCQATFCKKVEYLTSCAVADAYFQNCVLNTQGDCQTQNTLYFQKFYACTQTQFPACKNITDNEAYVKCFAKEFLDCSTAGNYLAVGQLAEALACTY